MAKSSDIKAKPANAAEHAYRKIQESILTGELKGGELLTEIKLQQLTGVSRTPIRDALKRLTNDGLVVADTSLQNRKSYVAELTKDYVEDLVIMRSLMESFAAKKAAEKISEKDLIQLEDIQAEIEEVIAKKKHRAAKDFSRLNEEFHRVIWEAGSSHAAQLLSGSLSTPFKMVSIPREKIEAHLKLSSTYHREIIRALRIGDKESVSVQIQAHALSSLAYIK